MSDEKDVGVEHKKKEIEAKDNAKLEEVARGYRILYFDEKHFLAKKFKINSIRIYDKSVLSISRYGDDLFTRTKNKLQKDPNMLTQQEQMKILTGRGLWGEEKEKELLELKNKAAEIIEDKSGVESLIAEISDKDPKKAEKSKNLHKKLEKIGNEWIDIYGRYMEVVSLNNVYFGDTIEAHAETAQRKGWMVSSVCKHMNGKELLPNKYNPDNQLWKTVEDFDEEMRDNNLVSMMTECMDYWESRDEGESFFAESPEDLSSDFDGDTPNNMESDSTQMPTTDLSSQKNS